MQINDLKEYIDTGRELEFKVNGKMCSITQGVIDGEDVISFCEFHQPSVEVIDFDALLEIEYKGQTLRTIWQNLKPEDVWIF